MRFVVALLAGLVLVLAGCGGGSTAEQDPSKLDDAAGLACDDFANGYKAAQTRDARVALANKVNEWAAKSGTNRISAMGAALGRGADASPEAWKIGADAFAKACLDAGWSAD